MIIPIGHEQTSVRRLPWVTFAIMALCTLILVLIAPGEHERTMVSFVRLHQALGFYTQHPYLEIDDRFQRIFVRDLGEEKAAAVAEAMRSSGPRPPRDAGQLQQEQQLLDRLVTAYYRGLEESVLYRFGLVPAKLQAADLVTHAFLHAGWFHLFFNMLLLFVIAPFIEDVWGRPLFAAFYLAAAAFAGIMFALRYPDLTVPLVGASGAIAGVMGAFLVRYLRSRLRFVLWVLVPVGPFSAPAWVVLPLWFFIQLLSAQQLDAAAPDGGAAAVAFWAHVWGFAFGVVVALVMRSFAIEERFIHSAIERRVTLLDNPAVEGAIALARTGDVNGALAELERELARQPENVDAAMAAWSLAVDHGQPERAVAPMLRAITAAVRRGDRRFVVSHWEEVLTRVPDPDVDPLTAMRIAEILEQEQRLPWALETLDLGLQRVSEDTPPAVLHRMAKLALHLESPAAETIVRRALDHEEMPPDARPELEVALWALTRQGRQAEPSRGPSAPRRAAMDEAPPSRRLGQVRHAVPLALRGERLVADFSGRVETLDLRSVTVVAASVIAPPDGRAGVVLDLLVAPAPAAGPELVAIRILSDAFDARALFAADDSMAAFRMLAERVLELSSAVPLPDGDAVRGRPFAYFPDLATYEREVLGVAGGSELELEGEAPPRGAQRSRPAGSQ